jgi:hypothetical protein
MFIFFWGGGGRGAVFLLFGGGFLFFFALGKVVRLYGTIRVLFVNIGHIFESSIHIWVSHGFVHLLQKKF